MAIWKLEPIEPYVPQWRGSEYVGPLFVRAQEGADARGLAARAFGKTPEILPGVDEPLLPWLYDWLATCELARLSGFDEEGPDAILAPEEALAKAHPLQTGDG